MSYERLFEFEQALAEFTGAPYAIATDGCTHAIQLCMLYDQVDCCQFTPYTYISVPMILIRSGIRFDYLDETEQTWLGEYQFLGTRIWDSARLLRNGMYRPGQMQCLSFGNSKPLQLGRVGAILLDDAVAYKEISMLRSDGRDLHINPWITQRNFPLGYHYSPTLELCALGTERLPQVDQTPKFVKYNDCRRINFYDKTNKIKH
jgi:dTDP-4-amino-4,6-dideoxygalactose transaminase